MYMMKIGRSIVNEIKLRYGEEEAKLWSDKRST